MDTDRIKSAVREFLFAHGEDPNRRELLETRARVAQACEELFAGIEENPAEVLCSQFHEEEHEEMVVSCNRGRIYVHDSPQNAQTRIHLQ